MSFVSEYLSPVLHAVIGDIICHGKFGGDIVAAQMIIKTDTHVLLIKPTYRPYWEFPGGAVEKGETTEDAASREVM